MVLMKTRLVTLFVLLISANLLNAQNSDFTRVHNILQANCGSTSCHGGAHPLTLTGTESSVYNALVNQAPTNPAALAKGNKLVDPGHPYNSYLLRKVGAQFDTYFNLEAAEGARMPSNGAPALPDEDIEVIRQWILYGADPSGNKMDSALVHDYYASGGQAGMAPPAPPAAGEGFQIRLGPIFLGPVGHSRNEIEYLKKEALNLAQDVEVTRVEGIMNSQSHHFLLFRFDDQQAADAKDHGLRNVNIINNAFDGDKQFTAIWQYSDDQVLPQGTAFFWNTNDWLDLNYHIKNYSQDSILPADFYLNVYTEPRGTGNAEMRAELVNNSFLILFQGTSTQTITDTWGGDDRLIWAISSHTHKYGEDFDIYVRNPNGSQGDQIYEGFYNVDYTFNQGFYDWEHPATRLMDPLYEVTKDEGLIAKTKYDVTEPGPVFFGMTTDDEMQLFTYLYVNESDLVNVEPEVPGSPLNLAVFPNPAQQRTQVQYVLHEPARVQVRIRDLAGKIITSTQLETRAEGTHRVPVDCTQWQSGIYFVDLEIDGRVFSRKLSVTK